MECITMIKRIIRNKHSMWPWEPRIKGRSHQLLKYHTCSTWLLSIFSVNHPWRYILTLCLSCTKQWCHHIAVCPFLRKHASFTVLPTEIIAWGGSLFGGKLSISCKQNKQKSIGAIFISKALWLLYELCHHWAHPKQILSKYKDKGIDAETEVAGVWITLMRTIQLLISALERVLGHYP